MPDIDLDTSQERRGEVIEYLRNKYGHDHVCQILTIGTLGCKAALKRVMTAYGIPFDVANGLTELIPDIINGSSPTIDDALSLPQVRDYINKNKELIPIVEKAKQIEGIIGFTGTHAAGVVITDRPVYEYTAIKDDGKGNIISQNEMSELESIGLLKLDILGIRNLDIIANTVEHVKSIHGVDIDWRNLPLDDSKTYQLYQRADTDGVFQMEGNLFKKYLPLIRPTEFSDLSAIVALIRPGPLNAKASDGDGNLVDEYIRRKNGQSPVRYIHPKLEPILADTLGSNIYQEQSMRIARELAGFTPGESDNLRRVIGKKMMNEMPVVRQKFVDGCVANGIDESVANRIFDDIETQSGYAFNLSHAVSYAYVSYATAYLKANYPVEFTASLLTSVKGDADRVGLYMKSAMESGVSIKPPSINISTDSFVPDGNSIRFGLSAIKGVGDKAYEAIMEDRRKNGPYKSFEDFLLRVYGGPVNKTVLESLVKSGALDEFGFSRAQMFNAIEPVIKAFNSYKGKIQRIEKRYETIFEWDDVAKLQKEREKLEERRANAHKELLTAISDAISADVPEWTISEKSQYELEVLGYYVSNHPVDEYAPYIESLSRQNMPVVSSFNIDRHINQDVIAVGAVSSVRRKWGSFGGRLEITLADKLGTINLVVYGNQRMGEVAEVATEGAVVEVKGRVIKMGEDVQIRVSEMSIPPKEPLPSLPPKVLLYAEVKDVTKIRAALQKRNLLGDAPVEVVTVVGGKEQNVPLGLCVDPSKVNELSTIEGVYAALVS